MALQPPAAVAGARRRGLDRMRAAVAPVPAPRAHGLSYVTFLSFFVTFINIIHHHQYYFICMFIILSRHHRSSLLLFIIADSLHRDRAEQRCVCHKARRCVGGCCLDRSFFISATVGCYVLRFGGQRTPLWRRARPKTTISTVLCYLRGAVRCCVAVLCCAVL